MLPQYRPRTWLSFIFMPNKYHNIQAIFPNKVLNSDILVFLCLFSFLCLSFITKVAMYLAFSSFFQFHWQRPHVRFDVTVYYFCCVTRQDCFETNTKYNMQWTSPASWENYDFWNSDSAFPPSFSVELAKATKLLKINKLSFYATKVTCNLRHSVRRPTLNIHLRKILNDSISVQLAKPFFHHRKTCKDLCPAPARTKYDHNCWKRNFSLTLSQHG